MKRGWRTLCEQIANENDAAKIEPLISEIKGLLGVASLTDLDDEAKDCDSSAEFPLRRPDVDALR